MKTITLEVTVDEANVVLESLGELPFVKVYALIGKIQEQARQQLNGQDIDSSGEQPAGPPPSIPE